MLPTINLQALTRQRGSRGAYYKGAIAQLEHVRKNERSQSLRIIPLLAMGKVERAEACAHSILNLDPEVVRPILIEDIYFVLVTKTLAFGPDLKCTIWSSMIERGCCDAFLSLILVIFNQSPGFQQQSVSLPKPKTTLPACVLATSLGAHEEAYKHWPIEVESGRQEDLFVHLTFGLMARVFLSQDHQHARELLNNFHSRHSNLLLAAVKQPNGHGQWFAVLTILTSARMAKLAAQIQSPLAPWWDQLKFDSWSTMPDGEEKKLCEQFIKEVSAGKVFGRAFAQS